MSNKQLNSISPVLNLIFHHNPAPQNISSISVDLHSSSFQVKKNLRVILDPLFSPILKKSCWLYLVNMSRTDHSSLPLLLSSRKEKTPSLACLSQEAFMSLSACTGSFHPVILIMAARLVLLTVIFLTSSWHTLSLLFKYAR